MGLVEDNLLRIEAKIESYLSIYEVMSIVNSSEHRDMDLVANVMDSLGIFSLTAYKQTGIDYEPAYEAIGVDYELKQKIKDFGNAQLIFFDNSACFEEFDELRQYISRRLWSRLDLLKIERLVEHTGLVSWGEHDALCFMYSEMVNSKDSEYHKLPKISKQAIDDYLNLGSYQRKLINRSSYSPEQIICLMTNEDPDYINHDDKYLVYWDIIKSAIASNELVPLNDNQDVEADQVKRWLKNNGLFYRKPDSNSLEQPTTISSMKKRIDELEAQISNQKVDKKDTVIIPFLKRIDCISKDLPQSERIKQSYEIYSDDISFYEDTHTVNSPDEMIKRIQGLLKVVRGKDSKIRELEKQTNTYNNAQDEIDELENQLAQAKADLADKPADDSTEQDHLYNWQAMDKNQYPPELHLAIEIWKEYYHPDAIKHISQFDAGRFNRIANDFNLSQGNLKSRIRSLLTPLNSKTKSPELLSSLEVINIIHNDKLEQD